MNSIPPNLSLPSPALTHTSLTPAWRDRDQTRATALSLSMIIPLCWGLLGLWAGKDGGWDLLNYHWYNPYAFLNDRLGFDLGVGHHATYYNPFLDIPLYLAGEYLPGSGVGFLLSFCQGLNFPLLFWLSWALFSPLPPRQRLALSAITAFTSMTGAGALMELAGVAHDNITSLGVLAALLIIVNHYQTLTTGNCIAAGGWAGLAGLLAGVTAGLKLTTATYALGLGGALLFIPACFSRRLLLAFSCAIGGIAGLALGGGYWMHELWQFSGSPFFPYFNDLCHSPLLSNASYKDERFIPRDLLTKIFFPFFFSFNSFRVAEWYFRDVRILTAFVVLPCSALWGLTGKAGRACQTNGTWIAAGPGRFLVVAAAISYAAWLWMFCIYRYLLPLEMLTPLLLAVALGWLPWSNRWRATGLLTLLLISQAMVRMDFDARKPWGDRYMEVTAPTITPDEQAMVLMTGYEPMSFIIPFFPPSIPFIRIEGYLASPHEPSTGLTAIMRQRVEEHRGALYVLIHPHERDSAPKALSAYNLNLDISSCRTVPSNVTIPLEFCRVHR